MGKYCNCPTSFNVTVGIFTIFLAVIAWLNIWGVFMPLWLIIITLILGLLLVFLNSANPIREKIDGNMLSVEEANHMHAREGY